MGRNRSLDEFAATQPDPATPEGDGGEDAVVESVPDDTVDPIAVTYAWSSPPGTCDECGDPAEERWRDGGPLVCPACKAW